MKPVVLFDLDGTLTNPRAGITACIRHALEALDRPVPGDDELDGWIGPPLLESFTQHIASPQLAAEALRLYRERFSTVGLYENELYPGIVASLDAIAGDADRLFVATSKPRVYAQPIVEHFGLGGFFANVYGSELDGRHADKHDLIAHLLDVEGVIASDALMVGDRRHDIEGAAANGVASVAALWGFGSRDELEEAGPTHFCASVRELPAVLAAA